MSTHSLYLIFVLISVLNMNCVYSLEPSHGDRSKEYLNLFSYVHVSYFCQKYVFPELFHV